MKHVDLSQSGLGDYLVEVGTRETPVQARLREETGRMQQAVMQISPDQGQLLHFLTATVGARRAIEVGTFTGYSALAIASALPADGELIACDTSAEWTAIARRYWQEAGLESRIRLRLAPALETLDALIAEGRAGQFDFAFVDADKTGYDAYYERCLALLRPGAVIVFDNMLWGGAVADPRDQSDDTAALRALNRKIREDARVDMCLAPVGDGMGLVRRR